MDGDVMNHYFIDMNINHSCNFRCKYCFERYYGYENNIMNSETLHNAAKYIRTIANKNDDDFFSVCFFGGEPLLVLDRIKTLTEMIPARIGIRIITNGYLIEENRSLLSKLHGFIGSMLSMRVSYDYSLQDNRHAGSYEKIRKGLGILKELGIPFKTITVLTRDNMSKYEDVVKDYVALSEQIGPINAGFNIDRENYENAQFDYNVVRQAFIDGIRYAKQHNMEPIIPNGSPINRTQKENVCSWCNVFCGIDYDGRIYPASAACFSSEAKKEMLCYGNVTDDYYEIERNKAKVISMMSALKTECNECTATCKEYPWMSISDDGSVKEGIIDKDLCRLTKLVQEVF